MLHSLVRRCIVLHFDEICIPRTLPRCFRLSFPFPLKLESLIPRLICLLYRTLRMNAVSRVRILAANGANVFRDSRNEWYRLEDAHVVPNCSGRNYVDRLAKRCQLSFKHRREVDPPKKPTSWNTPRHSAGADEPEQHFHPKPERSQSQ